MARRRGRSVRGERLRAGVPHGGNEIEDWGKHLSDDDTMTIVASGNRCAAVDIRGASGCLVSGNAMRMRDWAGGTSVSNKERAGVQIKLSADTTLEAKNNLVTGNIFDAVPRPIFEDTSALIGNNQFPSNSIIDATLGSSFTSFISGANSSLYPPINPSLLKNFADDTAAAAGGVPIGGAYRNGSVKMIRVS